MNTTNKKLIFFKQKYPWILGQIRFKRSRKHVIIKMGHPRFQCEAMQRGINFDS